jgi:lysophospholipase L1-like esterase
MAPGSVVLKWIAGSGLLLMTGLASPSAIAPDQPEASSDRLWIREHLRIKSLVQHASRQAAPDIYFLGDSITAFWPETGKDSWGALTGKFRVLAAGLSGDTTQNLLYRIQNGAFEGIRPRVVVLMAGLNNLGLEPSLEPAALTKGIAKIVGILQTKSPSTRILVLSLLPSSEAGNPVRARIRETNALLAKLANQTSIFYLNVHDRFLDAAGHIPPPLTIDGTHPSAAGYRVIAASLRPVLDQLLKAPAR